MSEFYRFGQQLREVLRGLLELRAQPKIPSSFMLEELLGCKRKETKESDGSVTTTCEEPDTCPKLLDGQDAVEKECRLAYDAIHYPEGERPKRVAVNTCLCIYKPKGAKCKLEDDKCKGDCPPLKDEQGNEYEGLCVKMRTPEAKGRLKTQCACVYRRKPK